MSEFGETVGKFLDNRVGTFGVTEDGFFRCGNVVYGDARIVTLTHTDPLGTFYHRQALVPCGDHTVSVAWGSYNYGENNGVEGDAFNENPMSAEVAIWKNDNPKKFVRLSEQTDDVRGWQTVSEVNGIIGHVRTVLNTPLI